MSDIRLDECDWFPANVRALLRSRRHAFEQAIELDTLLRFAWVRQVALQLEAVARTHTVIAYRCLRESEAGQTQSRGLPSLTLEGHQRAFLRAAWPHFTTDDIGFIRSAWTRYWGPFACAGQTVRTLLCLERSALQGADAQCLLQHFGCEATIWPLLEAEPIARKLPHIGDAVVAHIAIPGRELRSQVDYALGRAALSCHHRNVNVRALPDSPDAWIKRDIRPDEIRAIIDWNAHNTKSSLYAGAASAQVHV